MHDALLGTAEGDRIRCGLCPHACLIAEGAAASAVRAASSTGGSGRSPTGS